MDDGTDDGSGFGAVLAFLTLGPIFFILFVWLICAVVAGLIAESRGRSGFGFFAVTFFFLGPLGPGFALLAAREVNGVPVGPPPPPTPSEKRKVVDGRRRFTCPRCGAENDIPDADTTYDCWRCNDHRKVQLKVGTS
jgi:DNA-directed RNA polymerase subunit RPC12/RpoP